MSNRKIHFGERYAIKYGIREAILLEYIIFWWLKNRENDKNKKDGHYWTYGSASVISKALPFITGKQVWITMKSLEKQGAIVVGSYNKKNYDRTKWYRPCDEIIYRFSKMRKPIPVNNNNKINKYNNKQNLTVDINDLRDSNSNHTNH